MPGSVMPRSIRTRLTFWYASVLALALIAFSLTVWLVLSHILARDLALSLLNQSSGLANYLKIEDSDPSSRLPDEIDEYSRSLPQRHLLSVLNAAGQTVYSNWQGNSALPSALVRSSKPFVLTHRREPYLALVQPVSLNRGEYRTFLAIPKRADRKVLVVLGTLLAVLVPLFIAAGVGGGYWLSRKAMTPVAQITRQAHEIGIHDLSARLPLPGTHDELEQLTETWNNMLSRIELAVTKITQFTADASHELRTPVAVIRLASEAALRKERSAAEYQEALASIGHQSERMTTLIEDLLFLARADARLSAPAMQPLALQPLVEEACRDLAPLAAARQIRLFQRAAPAVPDVLANSSALLRVLRVLIENAIKYIPESGSVSVDVAQEQQGAVLRVIDTGVGIPPEFLNHIFERFYRVDSSRSKESGGYGLGLAIAAVIVHQHRATIAVEENPEGGSIFSVHFPGSG